jgi:hypothetical protein
MTSTSARWRTIVTLLTVAGVVAIVGALATSAQGKGVASASYSLLASAGHQHTHVPGRLHRVVPLDTLPGGHPSAG